AGGFGFATRSDTIPAGCDSIRDNDAPHGARTLTTTQSPAVRSFACTTVGAPCDHLRNSVPVPTANVWSTLEPSIFLSAMWLPPSTSSEIEVAFAGGVASRWPRKTYFVPKPPPCAAPAPTTSSPSVRAVRAMRKVLLPVIGFLASVRPFVGNEE